MRPIVTLSELKKQYDINFKQFNNLNVVGSTVFDLGLLNIFKYSECVLKYTET